MRALLQLVLAPERFFDEQTRLMRDATLTIEFWREQALIGWGHALDTACSMRIQMEKPEVDIRDEVDVLVREFRDQLARLEELKP